MNKKLLTEFQLLAGGSHYPSINPNQQELFAKAIVNHCINLVESVELQGISITVDQQNFVCSVKNQVVKKIKEQFYLP